MNIGFRIKQAIGLTGYNVKEFCELTERSRITTTLWINGRGGVIKEQSLEELCLHLRKCSVFCSSEWLKLGTGESPRLTSDTNDILPPAMPFENLKLNYEQIFLLLSRLDNNSYFEYSNSRFLIIAGILSKTNFFNYVSTLVILYTLDDVIIGTLSHYCKKSEILMVNTLENSTHCLTTETIQKAGAIFVLMDKKMK